MLSLKPVVFLEGGMDHTGCYRAGTNATPPMPQFRDFKPAPGQLPPTLTKYLSQEWAE